MGNSVENRIVVWSIQESRIFFGNGYYGKPLGVPKPKGTQFDTPLILDLIEGCYLVQTGKLKVSMSTVRRYHSETSRLFAEENTWILIQNI